MSDADDEALLEVVSTQELSERDRAALGRARDFIHRHDFATHRRSTSLVVELCAGLGAAIVVIASVVVLARGGVPLIRPAATPPGRSAPTTSASGSPSVTAAGSAAALARDRWTLLPPAPIAGRVNAASAWDGREMLVWGGATTYTQSQLLADGAAYDPHARTWSVLPASPLSARLAMAYVWTGRYLFIWGGYTVPGTSDAAADGALYDPQSTSWRRLPAAPLPAQAYAQAVWTGSEVLLIGRSTAHGNAYTPAISAYDPASDTWHTVAPIPVRAGVSLVAVTAAAIGQSVDVWESWAHTTQIASNGYSTTAGLDLVVLDTATGEWHSQATTAGPRFIVQDAIWTGSEVLTPATEQCPPYSGCPPMTGRFGYRFTPRTGMWTAMPHGPVDDLSPTSLWTGASLLSFDSSTTTGTDAPGEAAAWDPASDGWTRLADAPYHGGGHIASVWTGDRLLLWGEMAPTGGNSAAPGSGTAVGLEFGP